MTDCIAIDLGTTYSAVGIFRNGKVEIIPNEMGNRLTPSCVAFCDYEKFVGDAAVSKTLDYPKDTVHIIKRFIGKKNIDDKEVYNDISNVRYKVKLNDKGHIVVVVNYLGEEKEFYPEEISAIILEYLKHLAEVYLGKKVNNVVITVPAYFDINQRSATEKAAKIAGLNVLRIINEPTAAALCYTNLKLDKENLEDKYLMIFDIGGGTLDISILRYSLGIHEVVYTGGDSHLGGENFDSELYNYLLKLFRNENSHTFEKDISTNNAALIKLKRTAEVAKKNLSYNNSYNISLENLHENKNFNFTLSKALFENICNKIFEKCKNCLANVLNKINGTFVDEVILVGGSSRLPKIHSIIKSSIDNYQPNHPFVISSKINPDEAICYGACIQAAILTKQIDNEDDTLLIDVLPIPIGIQERENLMSILIKENTILPCEKSAIYTTYRDNQSEIDIKIYQGFNLSVKHNILLGQFKLENLPLKNKGELKINIKMSVDCNGILSVQAIEDENKIEGQIVIRNINKKKEEEMHNINEIVSAENLLKIIDKYLLILKEKNNENFDKYLEFYNSKNEIIKQLEYDNIEFNKLEINNLEEYRIIIYEIKEIISTLPN